MKKAIFTIIHGMEHFKLASFTLPLIQKYANRIGADLVVHTDIGEHKHPAFMKLDVLDVCSDYDRICYLDTDILIRDDAPSIFDVVPKNKIGIYEELPDEHRNKSFKEYCYRLRADLPDERYFNTGVMVFDMKDYMRLYAYLPLEIPHFGEQSAINISLFNKRRRIFPLSHKWNRMNSVAEKSKEWRFDSYIMHYAAYLQSPISAEMLIELMKEDLQVWKDHAPDYKFPPWEKPLTGVHMRYTKSTEENSYG